MVQAVLLNFYGNKMSLSFGMPIVFAGGVFVSFLEIAWVLIKAKVN